MAAQQTPALKVPVLTRCLPSVGDFFVAGGICLPFGSRQCAKVGGRLQAAFCERHFRHHGGRHEHPESGGPRTTGGSVTGGRTHDRSYQISVGGAAQPLGAAHRRQATARQRMQEIAYSRDVVLACLYVTHASILLQILSEEHGIVAGTDHGLCVWRRGALLLSPSVRCMHPSQMPRRNNSLPRLRGRLLPAQEHVDVHRQRFKIAVACEDVLKKFGAARSRQWPC